MSKEEIEYIAWFFSAGTRVNYVDSNDMILAEGTVVRVEPCTNDCFVYVDVDGLGEHPILSRFLEKQVV